MSKRNLRSRFAVFKHGNNVDIKPLLDSKDDLKIALNFLSRLFYSSYFLFQKTLVYSTTFDSRAELDIRKLQRFLYESLNTRIVFVSFGD